MSAAEGAKAHSQRDACAQTCHRCGAIVFAEIAQEVSIPEHLAIAKRELIHAMSSTVREDGFRMVSDFPALRSQTPAEIHILEPSREEAFIEAAHAFPSLAPYGQAGAGRLIDFLDLSVVQIEATIGAVGRVRRPEAI